MIIWPHFSLFGDEAETVFWDVALHYVRREKARLLCSKHKVYTLSIKLRWHDDHMWSLIISPCCLSSVPNSYPATTRSRQDSSETSQRPAYPQFI